MNVVRSLMEAAATHPHKEALRFEGKSWSFAEVESLSSRVAAGLKRSGVNRRDRVALYLPNCPEFIFGYLAIARLGAMAVSIHAQLKKEEVRHILDDCSAVAVLTDEERMANVPSDLAELNDIVLCGADESNSPSGRNVRPIESWLNDERLASSPVEMEDSDELAILYTSGTTGFPKGATLTHGNVLFTADSAVRCCGTRPDDRVLLMVPMTHCFGQNIVLLHALKAGATTILVRKFDPEHLVETIDHEKVTMLFTVPTVYSLLLHAHDARRRLQSVRYCHSGAAPLSQKMSDDWLSTTGVPIHQGYGLTESSPFACYNKTPEIRPTSIGKAIEGVEVKILDEDGNEVGPSDVGEIVVYGPNVMKGYWNKPDETAFTLRGGGLHTGDLGRKNSDGSLDVIDRIKDMINVSGLKVYPAEVERVLELHPAVKEAGVYGVVDSIVGERVRAQVVFHEGKNETFAELISYCRRVLAAYKVPESIRPVERLPRNPTGKLLRRVLQETE